MKKKKHRFGRRGSDGGQALRLHREWEEPERLAEQQNTGPRAPAILSPASPAIPERRLPACSGTNTGGAGGAASSTSSGEMGNTNNSKK